MIIASLHTVGDVISPNPFFLWIAQLLGSPSTRYPLTPTSSSPTTTWLCLATVMTTGWSWVTPLSPVVFITGKWQSIATTTTQTQPSASPGVTFWRTWCWGRTTRPWLCTWTTTAHGSCTTTRTPTGNRKYDMTVRVLLQMLRFTPFVGFCRKK